MRLTQRGVRMRPWGYLVVSVLGVLGTCIAMPAFGAGQAAAVDAQRLKLSLIHI